jgi:hypothetical protein
MSHLVDFVEVSRLVGADVKLPLALGTLHGVQDLSQGIHLLRDCLQWILGINFGQNLQRMHTRPSYVVRQKKTISLGQQLVQSFLQIIQIVRHQIDKSFSLKAYTSCEIVCKGFWASIYSSISAKNLQTIITYMSITAKQITFSNLLKKIVCPYH